MKVGDRVRVTGLTDFSPPIGTVGEIVVVDDDNCPYGVAFPGFKGLSLFGRLDDANGAWFTENELELVSTAKYLIEGFCVVFDTYEETEARAKKEAADTGEPVAIARVVAYAKPTISIIVEEI